jgi:hypothetical protein
MTSGEVAGCALLLERLIETSIRALPMSERWASFTPARWRLMKTKPHHPRLGTALDASALSLARGGLTPVVAWPLPTILPVRDSFARPPLEPWGPLLDLWSLIRHSQRTIRL